MEERIVANESTLPFRALPAAPLRGRGPLAALRGLGVTLAGVGAALSLLRELRPAAILGTGGYVCVPLFLAARIARVPTLIYLPDVVPGLAVRFLSRVANLTAVNVEDALPNLFGKRHTRAVVTGYPVRAELFNLDAAACRQAFGLSSELPVLFVYGGSRGARSINQAIAALLPELLREAHIIHVCGREGDAVWLREAAAGLPAELQERYKLYEYLASVGQGDRGTGGQGDAPVSPGYPVTVSMSAAFGAADLAVCRSGASTLAELPAAGLPAVLVPYPYVHQDENADYLVRRGAAVKVADAQMLGDGRPAAGALYQAIIRLLHNEHERRHMAEQSRALARPDAARHLAQALLGLTARSSG
jgi:UDP-N-acetylglucosamine--N-acetylmuramyl-(pentapeptide) pyrophosphoryl-undecaprenol N-acetylglucosamine transferase